MNHYTLAIISIVGSALDVLARSISPTTVRREHGPLRALTRGVTTERFSRWLRHSARPVFGIACGVTHG